MVERTELFKEHLQLMIKDVTGVKVSKKVAWELFKAFHKGTVEFVAKDEDNKLPLSGIGKFEILFASPTGKKAGMVDAVNEDGTPKLDKDGKAVKVKDDTLPVWDFIPRFKFRPSSAFNDTLATMFNCPDSERELEHFGIFKEGLTLNDAKAPAEQITMTIEDEGSKSTTTVEADKIEMKVEAKEEAVEDGKLFTEEVEVVKESKPKKSTKKKEEKPAKETVTKKSSKKEKKEEKPKKTSKKKDDLEIF